MFTFNRKEKSVEMLVDINVPHYEPRNLSWIWNCNSEIYAGLLCAELRKQFRQRVARTKRDAYAQGWADAKAKRRRLQSQDDFSGEIGD